MLNKYHKNGMVVLEQYVHKIKATSKMSAQQTKNFEKYLYGQP